MADVRFSWPAGCFVAWLCGPHTSCTEHYLCTYCQVRNASQTFCARRFSALWPTRGHLWWWPVTRCHSQTWCDLNWCKDASCVLFILVSMVLVSLCPPYSLILVQNEHLDKGRGRKSVILTKLLTTLYEEETRTADGSFSYLGKFMMFFCPQLT